MSEKPRGESAIVYLPPMDFSEPEKGKAPGEPEKPLHVKVAEALGAHVEFRVAPWFKPHEKQEPTWMRRMVVGEHVIWPTRGLCVLKEGEEAWDSSIPHFDTDWSATGPLIKRLQIEVCWTVKLISDPEYPEHCGDTCIAGEPITKLKHIDRDPLVAVCHVILKLAAAGKLVWKVSCS